MRLNVWTLFNNLLLFVGPDCLVGGIKHDLWFALLLEFVFLHFHLFLDFDEPFLELLVRELALQFKSENHADEHFFGLLQAMGVHIDELRTEDLFGRSFWV